MKTVSIIKISKRDLKKNKGRILTELNANRECKI